MTNSYFVRITKAYHDVSGMITDWANRAAKVVCYEHVGTETEKVHIHVLLVDCEVEKKMLKTMVSKYNLKGNKDWSWKERKDLSDTPMIYMTKGKLDPKFLKGYTEQEAQGWKTRWEEKREESVWEKVIDYCYGDEQYVSDKRKEFMEGLTYPVDAQEVQFRFITKYTQRMIFMYNKQIWTPQAANQYKCCVMTYVMRTGMTIPLSYKDWNKFL